MKFAVIAALSLVWLVSGCSKPAAPAPKGGPAAPRVVRVTAARDQPMERVLAVAGTLAADEQAVISARVPGPVARIDVDLGSVVKQGQVVAEIDRTDYELRLQQSAAALARARAAVGLPLDGEDDRFDPEATSVVREARALLDEATQNRDRARNLARSGVSSQAELDAVEAAFNVAMSRHESAREEARRRQAELAQRRAEHQLARQQLADTSLRAPFDGAVQLRRASLGEFLSIGAPVMTLVRTDPLRLRLEIPERESVGIRAGQHVRVRVEGGGPVHTGRLARLSPGLNENSRVLAVEADIPNDGSLRPGLFARAEIVLRADEPGLAVPPGAVVTFAGIEKVVLALDGRAKETVVRTGRRGVDWVEIVTGLKPGDRAIIDPGNLRTGDAVQEAAAAPAAETRSGN